MSKKNNQIPEQSSRIFRRIQKYPIHNMVKFAARKNHKKQENNHNKENYQSKNFNSDIVLLDKDIKAVFINKSHMFKKQHSSHQTTSKSSLPIFIN